MDLWSPLIQYEEVFYQRKLVQYGNNPKQFRPASNSSQANNFLYLNHILMGCSLFYLQRPLTRKEVAKYRLVLVQGTRKGRLQGLKLDKNSEIRGEVLGSSVAIENCQCALPLNYFIEITGKSHTTGEFEKWQLLTCSESTYIEWLEALARAKSYADVAEASNEAEKLRELAKRMKTNLVVRRRIQRFRLYDRTFVGISAIKWIMNDKQCTLSQAIAIGNRMLNLGIIFHVSNEHLLCPRNLLYRFSYEIDAYNQQQQPAATGTTPHRNSISLFHRDNTNDRGNNTNTAGSNGASTSGGKNGIEMIDSRTWEEVTSENHRLLSSYHSLQRDMVKIKGAYREAVHLLETFQNNVTASIAQSSNNGTSSSSKVNGTTNIEVEVTKKGYLSSLLVLIGIHLISLLFSDDLHTAHYDFYLHLLLIFSLLGIYSFYSFSFKKLEKNLLKENRLSNSSLSTLVASPLKSSSPYAASPSASFSFSSTSSLSSVTVKTCIDAVQEILRKLKKEKDLVFTEKDDDNNNGGRGGSDTMGFSSSKKYKNKNKKQSEENESPLLKNTPKSSSKLSVGSSLGGKYNRRRNKQQHKEHEMHTSSSEQADSPQATPLDSSRKGGFKLRKSLSLEVEIDQLEHADPEGYAQEEEEEDDDDDDDDDNIDENEEAEGEGDDLEEDEGDLEEAELAEEEEEGDSDEDSDDSASISISSDSSNEVRTRSVRSNQDSRSEKTLMSNSQPHLWPNYPILVCRSPFMLSSKLTDHEKQKQLQPVTIHNHALHPNPFIEIDNDFFIGKVYLFFDRINDAGSSERYSSREKKQKLFQSVVQGRFKKPIPFTHIYTGQAYDEEIQQKPTKWLVSGIAKLQPGFQYKIDGNKPFFVSPLMSTSQHIIISRRGQEPSLTDHQYEDNLSILGSEFQHMTEKKRKAYFAQRKNLEKFSYDPNFIYTFVFYQNLLNFRTFQIEVGFFKFDIVKNLGVLPVQIMALYWDPIENQGNPPDRWTYLYNFEVWHERSLTALLRVTEEEAALHQTTTANSQVNATTSSSQSRSRSQADGDDSSPEIKARSKSLDFLHKITHPHTAFTQHPANNQSGVATKSILGRRPFRKSDTSFLQQYHTENSNLPVEDSNGLAEKLTNKPQSYVMGSSSQRTSSKDSDGGNNTGSMKSNNISSSFGEVTNHNENNFSTPKRKNWLGKLK